MLEAAEGRFRLLEVPEVMCGVLLCLLGWLEAPEGMRGVLWVWLGVWGCWGWRWVIRCVLLCMLEAAEGRFRLLEVPEVMRGVLLGLFEVLEAPKVMRGVLLCCSMCGVSLC